MRRRGRQGAEGLRRQLASTETSKRESAIEAFAEQEGSHGALAAYLLRESPNPDAAARALWLTMARPQHSNEEVGFIDLLQVADAGFTWDLVCGLWLMAGRPASVREFVGQDTAAGAAEVAFVEAARRRPTYVHRLVAEAAVNCAGPDQGSGGDPSVASTRAPLDHSLAGLGILASVGVGLLVIGGVLLVSGIGVGAINPWNVTVYLASIALGLDPAPDHALGIMQTAATCMAVGALLTVLFGRGGGLSGVGLSVIPTGAGSVAVEVEVTRRRWWRRRRLFVGLQAYEQYVAVFDGMTLAPGVQRKRRGVCQALLFEEWQRAAADGRHVFRVPDDLPGSFVGDLVSVRWQICVARRRRWRRTQRLFIGVDVAA